MKRLEGEWAPLEKDYGQKLAEEEKAEVINQLCAFFSAVGEVYEKNRDYIDGLMDGIRQERLKTAYQPLQK